MKKYITGLLLFWMHIAGCFGQADERQLEGVVVDADSLTPLPYVHILVKNADKGGVTTELGRFSIRVQAQDSIVFTSVGYQPFLIVVADSTASQLTNLVIRMTSQTYTLEGVSIKAYQDITKYIRRKEKPLDMRMPENKPLFERQEPREAKAISMAGGQNGAMLEGGLTAFANLFNSKFQQEKKLKKLLEIEEEAKKQQYLTQVMTEKYQTMVREVSNLSEPAIQQFTDAHMPAPQAMLGMSDYALVVSILDNLQHFEPNVAPDLSVEDIAEKAVFEGEQKPRP